MRALAPPPLPGPRALKTVAPGVYTSPPEGIAAVRGECTGKLTLTPAASHYLGATTFPYPVVYDCAAKTFTVLKSLPVLIFASDLTLTKDGYYLHLSRFVDGIETGSYFFYDSDGKQIREVTQPADPKVHDLIVGDRDVTMIQYAHDWDSAGCGVPAALDIEIINKEFRWQGALEMVVEGTLHRRSACFHRCQHACTGAKAIAKSLRMAAPLLYVDRAAVGQIRRAEVAAVRQWRHGVRAAG